MYLILVCIRVHSRFPIMVTKKNAKRTQFKKHPNKHKALYGRGLPQFSLFRTPKKRTQNEPNLRRFKPNLRKKHENLCPKLSTTFHNFSQLPYVDLCEGGTFRQKKDNFSQLFDQKICKTNPIY